MGKSKKSKVRGAEGDDLDSSDADSVGSSSTALSDLTISYATENVNSHEFVLDKYIDALYEKRGSTREAALASLVDAFESFMLDGLGENKFATLLSLFNTSIKKGSTKEACLASRAIGLLSITLGAGSSSHETMVESHPQLSRVLQTWPDASKMISALDCLAIITFVGATDLAETELTLKAMWDVIDPKSGSNVGIVRKPKPPVLAAALSAWTFLLTTIGSWWINADSWKEPIAFLSTLLGAEDRAVRMAAGEALALCFELNLLDVSACEDDDDDTRVAGSSKSKLFLDMQALKAKISGLASNLSAEAGGKGADKKNLSDQRDLFQRILDFVKYGESPEESLKIAGKRDVLRVSSWSELIQLNFFKHFLGRGFLKHVQDNRLLQDIFSIKTDKPKRNAPNSIPSSRLLRGICVHPNLTERMDSDASISPRRRSCYSDSGDSSCSEPFSECGSDDLSFNPAAAAGIHRLLLSCASEASDDSIFSLVAELESPSTSVDSLRRAAMELRLLAKHNPDNRIRIAASGAVRPLVALLSHADPLLQEHGITALLNLSICDENKAIMVEAGAIRPLVHALKSAASPAARENAACALLRLSQLDGSTAAAVGRAGAIPLLVSLLETGSPRGKKDAATALYALFSGARENRLRSVEAGAVRPLLDLMSDPESGMVDKAAYVLHSLVGFAEGRSAAVEEGGIPVLVEMVEVGTSRQKEIATLSLLQICDDNAIYRTMVAREGAIPPLVALSQSSSARPKLKTKAEALIEMLRQPRSGSLRTRLAATVAAE